MKRRDIMEKIETKIIKVNEINPEEELILEGAKFIKEGKLVAFPTETVYGLGANGLNEEAVKEIFVAKGRPQDNPLILHVSSIEDIRPLVKSVSKEAEILMKKFWPGPLTLLFKKSKKVPNIITAGLDTVAIRMPNNPIALGLIKNSGMPIAAPSANTSGKPSPTSADHVIEDLYGKVHMIIDGGSTGVGLESTVLDLTEEIPMILRPGAITLEDLQSIIPNVEEDLSIIKNSNDIVPKSPGQKYRHYAPKADMLVFVGDVENMVMEIKVQAKEFISQEKTVGIMATEETKDRYGQGIIISVGSRKNMETIGHNLFNTIRLFDQKEVDIILAEGVELSYIGTAIMNRLKKASGGNIIKV
ncbi:tRNA(NNU) t(6)A37 threonylcarbamoyladenosine modification; threonine-dependent ADP-forming ATPase [[Clostridium] ultunense Esp]|uniref:Threonylcarbamoyl-AMP synthase n=2 Tax=Schnuerera ultunensis TaxID=45497 RepID=A0A1M4PM95_9FIRM|nr:tRNA(NNU) t(6)A37 threonylcarbamoyladenosine modification; threonine-dependent ADP-forming ATPase [[Clostridium] ultunense Esp]